MIPEFFIQELLTRIDIVDVVERYVPLRKGGANYSACCPFHAEKTPSFTVSPAKQFYHCFGCGAHGSAIGFVMQYAGLGYAPDDWQGLKKIFPDYAASALLECGLVIDSEQGRRYDRFRDRIMFPIQDQRGNVIGFGGRVIGEGEPKYLNSPETPLFEKGRELYGLHQARKAIQGEDAVLVVEGYMDVVALAQFGFRNVVAALGTAINAEQAELAFRAADEAVYCFDGDAAGRKAAWRALEATLPCIREGRQARFLFLPEGEDPDSMVRKHGQQHFAALLEEAAQPLSEFFFNHFTAQVDMDSIDGRARLVALSSPHLQAIPEGVFRAMMQERLEALARHSLGEWCGRSRAERVAPKVRDPANPQQRTPLRLAVAHLVQNPALVGLVAEQHRRPECDLPGWDIFRELVDFCAEHPNMTTAQLVEIWRDHPAQPYLQTLATWPLQGEGERQAQEFRDALTGLELQWTDSLISRMPRIIDQSKAQNKELLELQQRRQALKNALAGNHI